MRNGTAFFKPLFCIAALVTVIFFSACQKTSTTSTDIGDWAREPEYGGVPRTQAASFTIHYPAGDTVYIGGGYNGSTGLRVNDFYKYDEANQNWLPVAPFPGAARNSAVGFSINGKGYIGTGYDGTNYLSDFWQYDPATNTWDSIPYTFPGVGRYGAVGFAINGIGYVGTGIDASTAWYNDFYQFNPDNGWAPAASIENKRTGAAVFVYNNIAYLVGGVNNGTYQNDLEAYDPTLNHWTEKRKIVDLNDSTYDANYGFNITRSNSAAFLINDTAYLATGTYNSPIGTVWAYDITNDLWFQKTSFEGVAREGAIGFSINNHGYIATGDNGTQYFDDLWQFFPDAAQTNNDN